MLFGKPLAVLVFGRGISDRIAQSSHFDARVEERLDGWKVPERRFVIMRVVMAIVIVNVNVMVVAIVVMVVVAVMAIVVVPLAGMGRDDLDVCAADALPQHPAGHQIEMVESALFELGAALHRSERPESCYRSTHHMAPPTSDQGSPDSTVLDFQSDSPVIPEGSGNPPQLPNLQDARVQGDPGSCESRVGPMSLDASPARPCMICVVRRDLLCVQQVFYGTCSRRNRCQK